MPLISPLFQRRFIIVRRRQRLDHRDRRSHCFLTDMHTLSSRCRTVRIRKGYIQEHLHLGTECQCLSLPVHQGRKQLLRSSHNRLGPDSKHQRFLHQERHILRHSGQQPRRRHLLSGYCQLRGLYHLRHQERNRNCRFVKRRRHTRRLQCHLRGFGPECFARSTCNRRVCVHQGHLQEYL